jgi:hypothetical protein
MSPVHALPKRESLLESYQTLWNKSSAWEKMGLIPIVSNLKGAVEISLGASSCVIALTATVALGSFFLISKIFSPSEKSFSEICKSADAGTFSQNTLNDRLKYLTGYSALAAFGATAFVVMGAVQQVPVLGNMAYAKSLSNQKKFDEKVEKAMAEARLAKLKETLEKVDYRLVREA